ncbi:MAG: hypothetical protein MJE77_18070 [Proteobacteria bacterium]|nr:hypothetical protein [Pseudomonadota bacterium]
MGRVPRDVDGLSAAPPARFGRCGLVRDTRKKYHAALDSIREADKEQRQVILYMHQFDIVRVADHMVDEGPRFTADERAEARALLCRSPLQPKDVDLILATDVDGMTVPEYMKKRKLIKESDADNQRERDRLWRRRIRARKKLYEFLKSLQAERPVWH